MSCKDPCDNVTNPEGSINEINYLELLFDPDAIAGTVPANTGYYIPYNTQTAVKFNVLVDQYGTAISPDLTTGLITVNETGLYDVSYSLSWNNFGYTATGTSGAAANGYLSAVIVINSANIQSYDQLFACDSNNNSISGLSIPVMSQNGESVIYLEAGDTVAVFVRQRFSTGNLPNALTNLVSEVINPGATPSTIGATKIQIQKVR